MAFFFAGELAVEIFKPERQLIGIEALRTAAELHSLELFDDRFEALDLAVPMFDRADNIAEQAMEKVCICREVVKIELHVRFYSNAPIRRSNLTLFEQVSAIQPARSGRQKRSGARQSIPSINTASCAGVSVTVPPGAARRGHQKLP
jgi:hypothetical protein